MEHKRAKKKRGQPAPAPVTEVGRRLEQVCAVRGIETLLEFHARLVSVDPDDAPLFSYSAVRNYHFDRDPPLAYLERVAEVFNIRLAWLAAGQGAIRKEDEKNFARRYEWTDKDLEDILRKHLGGPEGAKPWTSGAQAADGSPLGWHNQEIPVSILALFSEICRSIFGLQEMVSGGGRKGKAPDVKEIAEQVAAFAVTPLRTYLPQGTPLSVASWFEYLQAMLNALNAVPRVMRDAYYG